MYIFCTQGCLLPQRYIFAILGWLAVANAYTMRVCVNIAITKMVKEKKEGAKPDPDDYLEKFDWDQKTQGLILGAFYCGYVLSHIPGGIIAEKFGGKYTLGVGIFSTAIFTLLTPICVIEGGSYGFIALRIVQGIGEGTTFPALNALLAVWCPIAERARMGSLVFGGSQIGNIFGIFLSGLVMNHYDWPNVFYMFGGLGLLWSFAWEIFCYSYPETHPFISEKEQAFLSEAVGKRDDTLVIPWRHIMTSVPLWALIVAQIGHDWGYFTMITDLPKYMRDVMGFNILKTGFMSTLPYIVMWFTTLMFGTISDFLTNREYITHTQARKIFTSLGATVPGAFMVAASYSMPNETLVVVMFTLSMAFMGSFYPGMKINALDLSHNFSGTLMALVNGIGAVSGIIVPLLIGVITKDSTEEQWSIVFWLAFLVLGLTNIVFVIWAQAVLQWWDDIPKNGYPENYTGPRTIPTTA